MKWGRVRIGGTTIEDSTGVFVAAADRQELIGVELGADGKLLLSVDVFGPNGSHDAKLRKNAWSFGDRDRFAMTWLPEHVRMVEKASGRVVVDARMTAPGEIEFPEGDLYTPDGQHIQIRPDEVDFGNGLSTHGEITLNAGGGPIVISRSGIQLGE